LEHVLNDEIRLRNNNEKGDMGPGEQRELAKIILLHQRKNKPHKSQNVHNEGDEAMMSNKKWEKVDSVDDYSKILHQGFAIEEVVRCYKKIPGH
jgi:hypothetical protein